MKDIVQKEVEKETMIQEMTVVCPFQRVLKIQMALNTVHIHKILLEVVEVNHL